MPAIILTKRSVQTLNPVLMGLLFLIELLYVMVIGSHHAKGMRYNPITTVLMIIKTFARSDSPMKPPAQDPSFFCPLEARVHQPEL